VNPTAESPLALPSGRCLTLDRPRIMGILNVTPDSFSDGGRWRRVGDAVHHGLAMAREGADIIDIGGESSRPGAERVDAEEQCRRILPVIRGLRETLDAEHKDVAISVDTTRAAVAEPALDAGAEILNDITAGREDQALLPLAAQRGAAIVLMHMRGAPATMQDAPHYEHVVDEVVQFLDTRAVAAQEAGVSPSQIVLDPGIGFGKTRKHNLSLLAALPQLVGRGFAVLLGTSRKRFMGSICTYGGQVPSPDELVDATCATTALGVAAGVNLFRVHDVLANRRAADVAAAIRAATGETV